MILVQHSVKGYANLLVGLVKYASTTRNIVNARPRYSRIHACGCIKSDFASFRPKNLQFLVVFLDLGWPALSSLKAEQP